MNNFLKSFRCLVSVVFLFAVAAYVTSVETSPTEAGQSPGFGSGDTVQTGPPQYQIIDIGVVQAGDTASQGFGASTGGVGVGRSFRTGGTQAFSWTQAGGIVGLPNLAGRAFAVANAANDSGRVVGTGATTAFGSGRLPIV